MRIETNLRSCGREGIRLKKRVLEALKSHPVIPSLRREELLPVLGASKARVVLVSSGTIFTIAATCRALTEKDKLVFVHIDLIGGLGRDQAGVRFLKEVGACGIVTPHASLVAAARKEGLVAVHRLFALDSPSLETGIKVLAQSRPDFIEVLPGAVLPQVASFLRQHFRQPLIAAGLIRKPEEVAAALRAGAVAVDTSAEELWDLTFPLPELHP